MKNLQIFIGVCIIVVTIGCNISSESNNHLLGKWKSLWDRESRNSNVDLNIVFEADYTFTVEALGVNQIEPQKITGRYEIFHDTLAIQDLTEMPASLCNSDTGLYLFRRIYDTLYFKVISDQCERRKMTFEIGLFKPH